MDSNREEAFKTIQMVICSMAGIFWLRDFVDSLGHEISKSIPPAASPGQIRLVEQYVFSRSPPQPKRGKWTSWWAVDRDHFDTWPEDVFLDFVERVLGADGSMKVIFLTDSSRLRSPKKPIARLPNSVLSKRRSLISAVPKCNLVDLPGPAINLPAMTSAPSPVPFLRVGEDDPVITKIEDDPVITKIPWQGEGPRDCASVIMVDPEVDCRGLAEAGYSYEVPAEMEPANWRGRRGFWEPPSEVDLWCPGGPFHVSPEAYPSGTIAGDLVQEGEGITIVPSEMMDAMGECYCRILGNAVHFAAYCLSKSEGQRGGVIIVRLSPHGARMGILNHPCYKAFREAVGRLDRYWKKRGRSVILREQYW